MNEIGKIILASQSPRRKQLLEWAEISFEVVIAFTDERYPAGLLPAAIAKHIATEKAIAVKNRDINFSQNNHIIIAADTIVVLGDKIIGKPADREEAITTLTSLSGKTHSVITGVCILLREKEIIFSDETFVEFNSLSKQQIAYYVDQYKPYDKAGAYAIQEWIGVTGIKSISGDFYNVMGLPVSRVIKALQVLGYNA